MKTSRSLHLEFLEQILRIRRQSSSIQSFEDTRKNRRFVNRRGEGGESISYESVVCCWGGTAVWEVRQAGRGDWGSREIERVRLDRTLGEFA